MWGLDLGNRERGPGAWPAGIHWVGGDSGTWSLFCGGEELHLRYGPATVRWIINRLSHGLRAEAVGQKQCQSLLLNQHTVLYSRNLPEFSATDIPGNHLLNDAVDSSATQNKGSILSSPLQSGHSS